MRCFIAIDIPEEIKEKIIKIQEKLPEFEGKKTEIENLHLTLKFLGEVDKEKAEEVKKRLNEIKFGNFESEIGNLGFFDKKEIRIIWIGISNCEKLQKEIDFKLKDLFELEKRFMGHLTIARVKQVKDKKDFLFKLRKIKTEKMRFLVDNFKLKVSELGKFKAEYKDLGIFRL